MPRKWYSREFKESAVKLVHEQGYSPAEAGKCLGIDARRQATLIDHIKSARAASSRQTYGAPRVHAELKARGDGKLLREFDPAPRPPSLDKAREWPHEKFSSVSSVVSVVQKWEPRKKRMSCNDRDLAVQPFPFLPSFPWFINTLTFAAHS